MSLLGETDPFVIIDHTFGEVVFWSAVGWLLILPWLQDLARLGEDHPAWRMPEGEVPPWWAPPTVMLAGQAAEKAVRYGWCFFLIPAPFAVAIAEPMFLPPIFVSVIAWVNGGFALAFWAAAIGVTWRVLFDWRRFPTNWSTARKAGSLLLKLSWGACYAFYWTVAGLFLFNVLFALGMIFAAALEGRSERRSGGVDWF